jgi:hypothetical protein
VPPRDAKSLISLFKNPWFYQVAYGIAFIVALYFQFQATRTVVNNNTRAMEANTAAIKGIDDEVDDLRDAVAVLIVAAGRENPEIVELFGELLKPRRP